MSVYGWALFALGSAVYLFVVCLEHGEVRANGVCKQATQKRMAAMREMDAAHGSCDTVKVEDQTKGGG